MPHSPCVAFAIGLGPVAPRWLIPVSCGDHGTRHCPPSVRGRGRMRRAGCCPGGCRTRWNETLFAIGSKTRLNEFCIEALEDAIRLYGRPVIFNTDKGSQFTSPRFTDMLLDAEVKISMDGRGRWMDNVMIERLWRSLKCECVYLNAFETGSEARAGIGKWIVRHLSRTDRVRCLALQHRAPTRRSGGGHRSGPTRAPA